jgi:hypothetical protein
VSLQLTANVGSMGRALQLTANLWPLRCVLQSTANPERLKRKKSKEEESRQRLSNLPEPLATRISVELGAQTFGANRSISPLTETEPNMDN